MRVREQSKAAPRPRGAQDTPIREGTKPPGLVASPPAQIARPQLAEGSRPFPDEEGLPAHCACTPQAPGSAGAAKQALPSTRSGGPHRQLGANN